ncbi:MAG: hypothetical protein COC23_07470 [Hyphomicrobiales bacterium]|nr:MAG: hypothetical protein COC23_07470 [Hyphomicrobiales bacterium]
MAIIGALGVAAISAPALAAPLAPLSIGGEVSPLFTLVASNKQCLKRCVTIDDRCRTKVSIKGDANGWDGDLRRSEWENTCAPKISQCQKSCGPIGPGECRIDSQGNEFCS